MARSKRLGRHGRVREAAPPKYAPGELTGVVLDSDVVIEILRGRTRVIEAATALERAVTPTFLTPIAWAEVYAGLRPGEEACTQAFFEARGELAIDARVGRLAGTYLARYGRSHGVEIADALVAAATARSGLRLWTLNRKHYPMEDLGFYDR